MKWAKRFKEELDLKPVTDEEFKELLDDSRGKKRFKKSE
jgi:hypothetical protein